MPRLLHDWLAQQVDGRHIAAHALERPRANWRASARDGQRQTVYAILGTGLMIVAAVLFAFDRGGPHFLSLTAATWIAGAAALGAFLAAWPSASRRPKRRHGHRGAVSTTRCCAIVNKPAGLMAHASALARGEDDFLADRLREQFGKPIHLVHRLDRATSGCLLVAFDRDTASALGKVFMSREVRQGLPGGLPRLAG